MPNDSTEPNTLTNANATSPRPSGVRGIILAAGKGTRMKSSLPKVLHPIGGKPMIEHGIANLAAAFAGSARPVVVIGHGAESVADVVGERAECVVQAELLGTGHAVKVAADAARAGAPSDIVACYADMPLLKPETFRALYDLRREVNAAVALLTVVVDNPRAFGRVIRDEAGAPVAIVEEIDCSPEQLRSRELNVGVYCCDASWLWGALDRLRPNARKGEYFLTDIVALAVADGRAVAAHTTDDHDETIGINTRVDLADAEAALRKRINRRHMLNGVTLRDPATTYIEADVVIGADTTILPNSHLMGATRIGANCVIGPNALLLNATIGDRVEIRQSVVRDSTVEDDSDVGPWSQLRNGAHVGPRVHIGNFGEVKNSRLSRGVAQGHFSYLGDATIGENVNVGAGTITCNFDGAKKNPTVIEDNAFIGSDTMLVAPVKIGRRARTGAGSVVTRDVPDGETVVGVPARSLKKRSD